jgi:hypothetical protein
LPAILAVCSGLMLGHAFASTGSDIKKYCEADAKRVCPGVARGGAMIECLSQREKLISEGCAAELKRLRLP